MAKAGSARDGWRRRARRGHPSAGSGAVRRGGTGESASRGVARLTCPVSKLSAIETLFFYRNSSFMNARAPSLSVCLVSLGLSCVLRRASPRLRAACFERNSLMGRVMCALTAFITFAAGAVDEQERFAGTCPPPAFFKQGKPKNWAMHEVSSFGQRCTCGQVAELPGAPGVAVKRCELSIHGINLTMQAPAESFTIELHAKEFATPMKHAYGPDVTKQWQLRSGDTLIDFGANLGFFSVLIALQHPGVSVFSYEADAQTATFLQSNIVINGLRGRVHANHLAITGDGRDVDFYSCSRINAGRHGMYENYSKPLLGRDHQPDSADCKPTKQRSTTALQIFAKHKIKHVVALKMDCEGCEHEVIPTLSGGAPTPSIERVVGECHMSVFKLTKMTADAAVKIRSWCKKWGMLGGEGRF